MLQTVLEDHDSLQSFHDTKRERPYFDTKIVTHHSITEETNIFLSACICVCFLCSNAKLQAKQTRKLLVKTTT